MAQRIVRMAPSVGNCLVPILIGYLCSVYTGDVVVMIYGAIIMQNCIFLASYTRPIYIEKVIRHTYNMLREAVEDEDEVIFSNHARKSEAEAERKNIERNEPTSSQGEPSNSATVEEDGTDVVVFNSRQNAKEILDPAIQYRENRSASKQSRFSSDFSTMYDTGTNRFSSDFGALDITSYARVNGYQELENIDRQAPQPLYRETTVNAPTNSVVFAAEVSPGTARRTASLKKNFFTITNMLKDINFYLYALLHLCTTFSILVLGLIFPPLIWEQNPSMNIWSVSGLFFSPFSTNYLLDIVINYVTTTFLVTICISYYLHKVSTLIAAAHGSALCFIMLCVVLPKSINEKARLCAAFCVAGAMGFYGIALSTNKSLLVVWCMLASFSTAASSILQQPLYNSTLNEFDTTATMTASNTIVAIFIISWSLIYNYDYKTCFLTASVLQTVTACMFFALSFRRRR
ncbi:hypothetical protein HF086_009435 [Spodoptera exigua]|uniref:Uncharacterized protein n=1 Tax=Spodoptera exigua TaxID=7107 RepID=A0A922MGE5_SPOEX|nr:hypothetical protein HF086_009435 [Spodoptera exigua]